MDDPLVVIGAVFSPTAKFVDEDVTSELAEAALAYLADYEGEFTLLCNLQSKDPDVLSTKQIRAVLNCIRAEVLYRERKNQAAISKAGWTKYSRGDHS